MYNFGVAFLVFHAFAVDEQLNYHAIITLGEHVVPAGDIGISQGIDAEHPAELVELIGLGAPLIGRCWPVKQGGLLGYKFGYFRKKKMAMGTASVTGMLMIWSIYASDSIFSSLYSTSSPM